MAGCAVVAGLAVGSRMRLAARAGGRPGNSIARDQSPSGAMPRQDLGQRATGCASQPDESVDAAPPRSGWRSRRLAGESSAMTALPLVVARCRNRPWRGEPGNHGIRRNCRPSGTAAVTLLARDFGEGMTGACQRHVTGRCGPLMWADACTRLRRRPLAGRRHGAHRRQRGLRQGHRRRRPGLPVRALPLRGGERSRWRRWRAASRARGCSSMSWRAVARSGADGAARHGRLHGAHAGGPEAHGRGRCRHHHGHPAGGGGDARRGCSWATGCRACRPSPWLWPSRGCVLVQATSAAGGSDARWSATCWSAGPCCARRASSCSASGWRRPTGRCGWRWAPTWRAWCCRSRSACSTLPAFDARTVHARRYGCSAPGTRSRPASSACGCGTAACRTWRPGWPASPLRPCRLPRWPCSALYLGEAIGPARLAGAALVIAAIVLGALSAPRQVPRA